MLPTAQRLRRSPDFQRVYRGGRSWAHPLLALHVLAQPSGQRLGISASKKVGKAGQRNRVRRRVREVLRARLSAWKHGFYAVVVVRAAAAEAPYAALEGAVEELARRARLVREPESPSESLYTMPPQRRGPGGADRGRPSPPQGGPSPVESA